MIPKAKPPLVIPYTPLPPPTRLTPPQTIADIFLQHERAGAMAVWSMGPLLGPVLGPVAGGFLVKAKGWRWVFWILAIFAGFFSACMFIFGRETHPATLLARKTKRLQKETGNSNLRSKLDSGLPPREIFARSIVRPIKILVFSPIVLLMSIYVSINYGIMYVTHALGPSPTRRLQASKIRISQTLLLHLSADPHLSHPLHISQRTHH